MKNIFTFTATTIVICIAAAIFVGFRNKTKAQTLPPLPPGAPRIVPLGTPRSIMIKPTVEVETVTNAWSDNPPPPYQRRLVPLGGNFGYEYAQISTNEFLWMETWKDPASKTNSKIILSSVTNADMILERRFDFIKVPSTNITILFAK